MTERNIRNFSKKKYKNMFYYYIKDGELWVEDCVLPMLFIKYCDIESEEDLNQMLERYYRELILY